MGIRRTGMFALHSGMFALHQGQTLADRSVRPTCFLLWPLEREPWDFCQVLIQSDLIFRGDAGEVEAHAESWADIGDFGFGCDFGVFEPEGDFELRAFA